MSCLGPLKPHQFPQQQFEFLQRTIIIYPSDAKSIHIYLEEWPPYW